MRAIFLVCLVLAGCVRLREPTKIEPTIVIMPPTQLEMREQAVREREAWQKEQDLDRKAEEAQEKDWRVYPK